MISLTVTPEYIDGLKSGRDYLRKFGADDAQEILDNIAATLKGFPRSTPIGQHLLGERDFWINQLKKAR
jgi:hypothetical protein